LTDMLIDELYALLFLGPDGPLLESRMLLKPDPAADSHFIAAPRPVLTRDAMARVGKEGLLAETGRLLDDLPQAQRAEVIGRITAIIAALQAEGADANASPAEPSSISYTLH
jgi:hypothetical protein